MSALAVLHEIQLASPRMDPIPQSKNLIAMISSRLSLQFSTHIALAREQDIKAGQKNKWCCSKAIFKDALLGS
jgi:hypothetical protein